MSRLNLSKKAAAHMRKNLNFSNEEEEVVVYSFEMFFNYFFTFTLICLASWIFGCLSTALTGTFVTSLLRTFSGGAHSNTSLNCTLVSVVMATLIGKISIVYGNQMPILLNMILILIVLLISFRIIWVLAPVDSPTKPITSKNHRDKLHNLSLVIVVSLSFMQLVLIKINYSFFSQYSLATSLGITWQTFTLTSTGHIFVSKIDDIFYKLKGGGKR